MSEDIECLLCPKNHALIYHFIQLNFTANNFLSLLLRNTSHHRICCAVQFVIYSFCIYNFTHILILFIRFITYCYHVRVYALCTAPYCHSRQCNQEPLNLPFCFQLCRRTSMYKLAQHRKPTIWNILQLFI